jgi:vacuolar-type H+-ATPase subunit I/STV1
MEISEVLESEEGKAAIAKAVEEATSGLKTKNDELLGTIKKEKETKKSLEERLDEIEKAKKEAEEEAALKSGDIEKIRESLQQKHSKEVEELTNKLSDRDTRLQKLLIDNGLTDALTKAGVHKDYMDATKALIKANNKAEITEIDGETIAQIDGKPLTEFVSQWSQGDQGKPFIAAAENGGGGANGTNSGGKANTAKKKADMSVKEKTEYIREHGQEEYNKLK